MMTTGTLDLLLAAASLPALASTGYLAVLTAFSRRLPAPPRACGIRFDVVVPAHDEEAGIAATVASLLAMDYPVAQFRVIVVADNCADGTAERARRAGAHVIERHDPSRRGKGYALELAYRRALSDAFADAVVVVDADTVVSRNLLGAFAARFAAGADAVQAEYGVRNAGDSWRTRLMVIALTLFHTLRSVARERLGLSCGLRGNGMAFSTALLARVPASAYSVVEDVEYGVTLGLAGVRIEHVDEASVLGEMPATGAAARSQRERWEGGRFQLARRHVPVLLRAAAARRDGRLLDLALDLLVPPLSTLAVSVLLGVVLAVALSVTGRGSVAVVCWSAAFVCLITYVGRGVVLSRVGMRAVADLAWAPLYIVWKLALRLRGGRRKGSEEWIRTARAVAQEEVRI